MKTYYLIASSALKIKCGKSKDMQERVSIMDVWCGYKNSSLGITVRHHSASLVMLISDPRDRFLYPHHTSMKDTYNLYINLKHKIQKLMGPIDGNTELNVKLTEMQKPV